LAEALSFELGIPYLDLRETSVDPVALNLIPLEMAKKYQMLPVAVKEKTLILAMEDPDDFEALDMARRASGLRVRPYITAGVAITQGIDTYYSKKTSGDSLLTSSIPTKEPDEDTLTDSRKDTIRAQPSPKRESRQSQKRIKLGQLFIDAGLISQQDLQVALEENARHPNEKLGQTLVRLNYVNDQELAQALSFQLGIPYIDLKETPAESESIKLIPLKFAKKYRIMPVAVEHKTLILAMEDPFDFEAIEMAAFSSGCEIHPHIAGGKDIEEAIELYYSVDSFEDFTYAPGEMENFTQAEIQKLMKESEKIPVIKLVDSVVMRAISSRASDIHIEPQEKKVLIRHRIDGMMRKTMIIPKWVQNAVVSRIKIMANMDISERRLPQDGKIKITADNKSIDLRISTLPTQYGEKVVIRILDTGKSMMTLEEVGLLSENLRKVRNLIHLPKGIILVCGPTGSGKTTTIYAALTELVQKDINIITLEDPIEYALEGLNQVQINEKTGLTFAKALRSVLRQDPNVIFVGEIRDLETAEIALRASMTGHLVISTLHTNDAVSTISRLVDMNVAPYLIASCVSGIISQRLLRVLCEHCREEYKPSPEILQRVHIWLRGEVSFPFYRGQGCDKCQKTGYRGRIPVHEILVITPEIRGLITQRAPESAIQEAARKHGMHTIMEDAVEKLSQGRTTIDEVERILFTLEDSETTIRLQCPSCHEFLEPDWRVCPYCTHRVQRIVTPEASPMSSDLPPVQGAPFSVAGLTPISGFQFIERQTQDFRGLKILIVEDDEMLRKTMAFLLSEEQFTVTMAQNGKKALEEIAQNTPQLVITDIVMPEMDGLTLIKQLRQESATASIPVIILSQKDRIEDKLQGFAVGIDDYLPKPFSLEELLFRVNAILKRVYPTNAM
jgi:type IV pilus assembly protein PilB